MVKLNIREVLSFANFFYFKYFGLMLGVKMSLLSNESIVVPYWFKTSYDGDLEIESEVALLVKERNAIYMRKGSIKEGGCDLGPATYIG